MIPQEDPEIDKKDMMKRLQYPADREFEKIIDDYLDMEAMQNHLQENFNLLVCTNKTSAVADVSRKFLFGFDTFQFLQSEALDTETTTKASAFRLETQAEQKEVEADLREQQRRSTAYGDKEVYASNVTTDGDDLVVDLNYTIERRGKLQGLAQQKKSTSFTIENYQSEGASNVSHEYDKVNEQTAINEFLEGWNKDRISRDKPAINKIPVTLALLSLSDRVELVRDIMTEELDNWTRKNVEGVDVHRDESIVGEDERESGEDLDSELEGIRDAALTGNRLDTNEFVQKCEDNGFFLTLVKIRYQHKTKAREVVIEVEFKQNRRYTFEVSINSARKQIDGEWSSAKFDFNERKNIRQEFREMVLSLYDSYDSEFEMEEI